MKQIELELKERLPIVEAENFDECQLDEKNKITLFHNGNVLKFICKGSELTEEIAKGLALKSINQHWKNLSRKADDFSDLWLNSALSSFISAIEAKQRELGFILNLDKCLIFKIL